MGIVCGVMFVSCCVHVLCMSVNADEDIVLTTIMHVLFSLIVPHGAHQMSLSFPTSLEVETTIPNSYYNRDTIVLSTTRNV